MSGQTRRPWRARLDKWLRVSVRRRLLDEHLAGLAIDYGSRVLEIGAGRKGRRGEYAPPIENARSWVQLDLRTLARPHLLGDLQQLPFKQKAFDCVLCLEVLQYLSDPSRGLFELHRTLRPGGVLVLATPFFHRADTEHDMWRFTEPGLRTMLVAAGFEVVTFKAQGAALASAINTLKFVLHKLQRGRLFWGTLLYPVLNALWKYDKKLARAIPVLNSFSTGYLVLARTGTQ